MALLPSVSHVSSQRCLPFLLPPLDNPVSFSSQSCNTLTPLKLRLNHRSRNSKLFSVSYRYFTNEEEEDAEDHNFDDAVALFNGRDYYKCHDHLEALWHKAEEPTRTLIHGILQCAVGFHHLFNQVSTLPMSKQNPIFFLFWGFVWILSFGLKIVCIACIEPQRSNDGVGRGGL